MNKQEFERLGKEASRKYLEDNIPLNETITKLAKEYGLNRDQISRVVENANVETHLNLYKEAEDKYIEFDTADVGDVVSNMEFSIEKDAALMNDYEEITENEEFQIISDITDEEKDRIKEAEKQFLFKKAEDLEYRLTNRLEEIDQKFQRESENLYFNVKQAALQMEDFSKIRHAARKAVPGKMTEALLKEQEERLKKEAAARVDFSEKEFPKGTVNENNPIVKSIKKLSVLKERYKQLKKHHTALEKAAAKTDLELIGQVIKGLKKASGGALKIGGRVVAIPFKHPKATAVVGGAGAAYGAGKRMRKIKESPTNLKYRGNYERD